MKQTVQDYINTNYPEEEIVICDGFDNQFLGIGRQFNRAVAIYSKKGCIEQIVKENQIPHEQAEEYFLFNIQDAYVGEKTPIFLE